MNWTLEVVIVPVSDVERAKKFYADQLGFTVDHDTVISDEARIVQLTPPGSGCSIVIGKGVVPEMPPGSLKGLQLVVPDLKRAHDELVERGVEVSEIQVVGQNPGRCRIHWTTSASSSSPTRTATPGASSRSPAAPDRARSQAAGAGVRAGDHATHPHLRVQDRDAIRAGEHRVEGQRAHPGLFVGELTHP